MRAERAANGAERLAGGAATRKLTHPFPTTPTTTPGCLTGAVVSLTVQPLDVLRTRMQADAVAGRARGAVATARAIVQAAGVRCVCGKREEEEEECGVTATPLG